MYSRIPATVFLIIVNVLVFIATYLFAGTFDQQQWFVTTFRLGALFNPRTLDDEWYRIFTHMFLHGHFVHLLVNMLALFSAGREIESLIGTRKFLWLYFISGLGAAIVSLYWSFFTVGVGASGAIFGILGFSVTLNLLIGKREGRPILPILINLIIFIFINVVVGEMFHADHAAHFGGLITGGLFGLCYYYAQRESRSKHFEYAFILLLIVLFFALPRYQVHYYRFFSQLLRAENEGKAMLSRNLSDRQYLKQLQFNNIQWDSARTMLRAHSYVPAKLRKDTSTLSHYIGFRMQENDYKARMIRDEKYILMDSLEILQDSIGKYLQIEHPVPVDLGNARIPVPSDSVPAQSAFADRVIRVWYDSNWVESDVPGPYYRIGARDSIGRWQGAVRDFYEDGKIQMKGAYKDSKRDGIFLYYSHHNTYTSAGRYADNRSIGKWQTFHPNGQLESEITYGDRMFTNSIWDSTGVALVSGGTGTVVEFYQNGRKKSEGQYRNGSQEGIWMGWHPDGSIYYKEEFSHGLLVHGRSRSINGEESIYDGSTLIPVPLEGHRRLNEYISDSVRKIDSPANGTVRMFFRVTAAAILTDFEIEHSISPALDQKAIDLIKKGPGWMPAKLHGHQPIDGFAWIDVNFDQ